MVTYMLHLFISWQFRQLAESVHTQYQTMLSYCGLSPKVTNGLVDRNVSTLNQADDPNHRAYLYLFFGVDGVKLES